MTNAIILDGSTQYGVSNNYAAINALTAGTMTWEAWFNQSASGTPYMGAMNLYDGVSNGVADMETENGTPSTGCNFAWNYSTTSADGYKSSGVFDTATWVHIAVAYTLNDVTHVYKNGTEISYTLQETPAGTPNSPSGMNLYLGAGFLDSSSWLGNIGGFFRVWNYTRTQIQINANQALTLKSAQETGLIANFNFTEGSGTTIANEYSSGQIMNLIGSPAWTTGPTTTPQSYGGNIDFSVATNASGIQLRSF
jgi:hypothetical protein